MESTDFYPNLCSLELSSHIIQANRKTKRLSKRSQTLPVQGEMMAFAPQVNFSRYTNTPEQGIEVLFYPQSKPGSYVQCNSLFPLKVTNAIFCR